MTKDEAKDHIKKFLETVHAKTEEAAFVEGCQQYRHLKSLGCEPTTYFRAVFELMIENDPQNVVHIKQSELSKWIQ